MDRRPVPLAPGTLLHARFEVDEVLGQGGFGITYRAKDRKRGDVCVIRELAPATAERLETGHLLLSRSGEAGAQRLRHTFLHEVKSVSRFGGPGLLPVRASFVERGTAFMAREHLPGAMTLAERLMREGTLPAAQTEALLSQLAEALQRLHQNSVLHLDLRPSNILISPSGSAYLIDFGYARKWYRELFREPDLSEGLAPELKMRGSRVGPAADVFQLAATAFAALSGRTPREGEDVASAATAAGLTPWVADMLGRGLRTDPGERLSVVGFFASAPAEARSADAKEAVERFDAKAQALKSLRFDRRQCPSCGGVLDEPKPLKLRICPVCHEGSIRPRKIVERLCPHCRQGILRMLPNLEPPTICPVCAVGLLNKKKKAFLSKEFVYVCAECEAEFEWQDPNLLCVADSEHIGSAKTCAAWREACGRSSEVWKCPGCDAQFDRQEDGRWRQAVPSKSGRFDLLEPSEWARVAAGLPPEAGNAECDSCGADYYVDGEDVALLQTRYDTVGASTALIGRVLTMEELRWIGVGKESPHPGLVCRECQTELDFEDGLLRLVRSSNSGMLEYYRQPLSFENWQRAARDLPLAGEEKGFEEAFEIALREAFREGTLNFSDRDPNQLWKGQARRSGPDAEGGKTKEGQIVVTKSEIQFGGLWKKAVLDLAEVQSAELAGDRVILRLADGEAVQFEIEPIEFSPSLISGSRSVRLSAGDLTARLRYELGRRSEPAQAV